MDTLVQDLRYAVRSLLKSRGFALVAVLTLALGIGANTAIFSVVNRLLFHPFPFIETGRLAAVWSVGPRGNDHIEASAADFRDWRANLRSFDHLVAHSWWRGTFTGGDRPEQVQGFQVSPDYFDALGVRPALGRTFAAGEDEPGKDRLVILSWGLWQRRFGGDRAVLGTTVTINGIPRTVIGVMPEGVRYPTAGEMWAPLALTAEAWASRRAHYLLVTGRLAPGSTLAGAGAELAALGRRLSAQYPETSTGWGTSVRPFRRDVTREIEPILAVLFGAVGFVLLIACANVANLMLARATGRRREFAIRSALGAAQGRLTRLVLTESLVLSFAGALAGVIAAVWGVDLLIGLVPAAQRPFVAGIDRVRVDGPVLAFSLGLAVLSAVLFGLVPAVRAAHAESGQPLRGGASTDGRDRHRLRRTLVGVEVALALMLLVGAGLMFRTFRYLGSVEPGFDADGIALTSLALPARTYPTDSSRVRFTGALLDRVAALPGVTEASAAVIVPLCGCNATTSFNIVGAPPFAPGDEPDVGWRVVTPRYFAALRIPVRRGRAFTDADAAGAAPAVIVNETLERRWFPDGGALGRRLYVDGDTSRSMEIVGVVGDVRHGGPARPADPELYLPEAQNATSGLTLVVRTSGEPRTLLPGLRRAVQELDPDQAVFDQRTLADAVEQSASAFRFALRLLAGLGVLALGLAGIGIYGVIANLVAERTREIGIRMALGGDQASVRRLVVRQGMAPAVLGLAAGLGLALALTRVLEAQMVGISPRDPLTFGVIALLLLGVAYGACWVPARRAARVDPMVALRNE